MPARGASWPTGCATRSHHPAGTATVDRRRRLEHLGEIDRVWRPKRSPSNFGEALLRGRHREWLPGSRTQLCSSPVLTPGSVIAPYYTYNHSACVVNYTGCHTGGSSVTGVAFCRAGRIRRSTTARCSPPTTPATRSGRCCRARTGCPTRPGCSRSSASRRDGRLPPGILVTQSRPVLRRHGRRHRPRITYTAANQPRGNPASPTNGPR